MVAIGVCDLVSRGDGLIAALASSLRELGLPPPLACERCTARPLGRHTFAKTFQDHRQRTCPRISPAWCAHRLGAALTLEAMMPAAQQGVATDNAFGRASRSLSTLQQNAATLIWNDVASSF
jgi:hypothetical protein